MSTPIIDAARGESPLTPAALAALRPHVINTQDGVLATSSTAKPRTIDEFTTTAADIRRIVKDLGEFAKKHPEGPLPVVIYAHGGLVDKKAGLETAHAQVAWWKDNGVYPIHVVWETGIWTALADVVLRRKPGSRGFTDVTDGVIEGVARLLGGRSVWGDMKLDATANSVGDGGAAVLAAELAAYVKAHPKGKPGEIRLHAVGHSAGSIFHSHFVPKAISTGAKPFESVSLLAPAVRLDTFEATLLPAAEAGDIRDLSIFTMNEEKEKDDSCFGLYRKSLLYLVSRSFEPERDAAILGMAAHIRSSERTKRYLAAQTDRLVLSPITADARSASTATSHGDFDNDRPTMESVLRRITGTEDPTPYPARTRSVEPTPPAPTGGSRGAVPRRRALCIGVNAYPDGRDRLEGCVPDALSWSAALEKEKFTVEQLLDDGATRDAILAAMIDLVTTSQAGDVVAIQYSGHGTYVPDEDGDEVDEFGAMDEAICPVDFRKGSLIIDDDLAQVWDLIPEGVALTLLFDSCHSGTVSRGDRPEPPAPTGQERPRLARRDKDLLDAYLRARAIPVEDPQREEARDLQRSVETSVSRNTTRNRPLIARREVLISACLPNEVAMERNGQGVFTKAALGVLGDGKTRTNREFVNEVVGSLGNRTQTPLLTADDALAERILLAPVIDLGGIVPEPKSPAPRTDAKRNAAIISILRATADLLEEGD